jgi:hypothetical protein
MNDMAQTIIPKSDQLNADDLIAGPITIKITGVTIKPGEQPVAISYEGDKGKPYKCCKSMARILVSAWGADSKNYVGRSLTLYRDPAVKWGGMEVGGIRISHMSDIDSAMTMALTVTRANKKPFTVKPLVSVAQKAAAIGDVGGKQPVAESSGKLQDEPPVTAAAPFTADQVIDVSDRLKPIMRGKERLLNALGKKLKREFTSLEQIPESEYKSSISWIEKASQA